MIALAIGFGCILWGAAGYRIALAIRRPASWRTAYAVSVSLLAVAATAHFRREYLDAAVGVPNVTNLGSRIAMAISVTAGQFYVLGTRTAAPSQRRHRTIYFAGASVVLVSTASWFMAPIHSVELSDLAAAPAHPASLVYAVTIYLYVAWFLVDFTRYAHQNFGNLRHSDPPAAVAAALIASSGWTGVPVLLLFATHMSLAQLRGYPDPYLDGIASVLFPLAIALNVLGLLMVPLSPVIAHRRAARRMKRSLGPLWQALVAQHPHLHLPITRSRVLQHLMPRMSAQRHLIEISDALEERKVPAATTMAELADALRAGRGPGEALTAKDALVQLDQSPWPQPVLHLSTVLASQNGAPANEPRP